MTPQLARWSHLVAAALCPLASGCNGDVQDNYGTAHVYLRGAVTTAQGQPASGTQISVAAYRPADCSARTVDLRPVATPAPITGADGRFETEVQLLASPAGEYCLVVTALGTSIEKPRTHFADSQKGGVGTLDVTVAVP